MRRILFPGLLAGLLGCAVVLLSGAGNPKRPVVTLAVHAVGLGDTLRLVAQAHTATAVDSLSALYSMKRHQTDTFAVYLAKRYVGSSFKDSTTIIPAAPWNGGDTLIVSLCVTAKKTATQPQQACAQNLYVKPFPLGPVPIIDSLQWR